MSKQLTRFYHRGNDDLREGQYLTAICRLDLKVDTSACKPKNPRGGPNQCEGEVKIILSMEIRSPSGVGNGNGVARSWVRAYGIQPVGGKFKQFDNHVVLDGEGEPSKEHWKVSASVEVGKVPCQGGAANGKVDIMMAPRVAGSERYREMNLGGMAYQIMWRVKIVECGEITVMDMKMIQGAKAFALDAVGGQMANRGNLLQEVKPGDKAPFPTKDRKDGVKPAAKLVVKKNGDVELKK